MATSVVDNARQAFYNNVLQNGTPEQALAVAQSMTGTTGSGTGTGTGGSGGGGGGGGGGGAPPGLGAQNAPVGGYINSSTTTTITDSSSQNPLISSTLAPTTLQLSSSSTSFTPYVSTSTPFSGSVSQYQNNHLQQTDLIYQNQLVGSQPVGGSFNYYGVQGGSYLFNFNSDIFSSSMGLGNSSSGFSGMVRSYSGNTPTGISFYSGGTEIGPFSGTTDPYSFAFNEKATVGMFTGSQSITSSSPSISPSPVSFGLPSTSGMGFAGIGEAFTGPIKAFANIGFRIGETVYNDFRFGIGKSGFVNGYDAKLNPIQPVTGLDYAKQFTGYSSLTPFHQLIMPVNTIFATSIIAENPVKPSVNLIGVENRVTMSGVASDLKPQVNTNFFFHSDMPSAGGLMSEPYFGVAKGTLKVNSFSEVATATSQTGRGAVVGGYQPAYELLGSTPSGTPTIFTSKQFMVSTPTTSPVIDLYSSRQINLAGEVNVQKTIGEVSTINPATLEAYSSKGFIGRSINFEKQVGETSVQYLKGDTQIVNYKSIANLPDTSVSPIDVTRISNTPFNSVGKFELGQQSSFEGVVFRNPIKTGGGSGSDIVSFQGGGKPSSPQFFENLYKQSSAQTSSSVSAALNLPKTSEISFSIPKSLPSISYSSQIPQSQYYGTGQYERTSEFSAQVPKMNQLSLQSNLQTNFQTNLNLQPQFQTPFQTQINIQPQIQNRMQVQNNIQTQIQNQLQVQNQITTTINPPIVPPPIIPTINPPIIPPFKFLPGGSSELGIRNFGARKNTRYFPDFGSLLLGRKGKYRKGKLSKSGLDIRPITPGFSFQTGLSNAPLVSNTFEKFRNNLGKTKLFKTKPTKRRKK